MTKWASEEEEEEVEVVVVVSEAVDEVMNLIFDFPDSIIIKINKYFEGGGGGFGGGGRGGSYY